MTLIALAIVTVSLIVVLIEPLMRAPKSKVPAWVDLRRRGRNF